jgi:hypothetical protein
MIQRLLISILLASICAEVQATTANFDTLSAGTSYAAPALFSNGGLDFDVLSGLGNLNVAAASGLVNPSFTGNHLNLTSNIGLNVNLPTGSSQIQFDFIQNNSAVALVINGGWLNNSQIPSTVNGVTVTHSLGDKSSPWGSISANGTINSFVIVGTSFLVDNVNATLAPGLAGDYNKNHAVDAGDYAWWRKNLNSRSGYNSWRGNFGATGAGTGTSIANLGVPEPTSSALLLVGLQFAAILRRSRRARRSA